MNGSDGKGKGATTHNGKYGKSTSLFGGLSGRDDDKIKKMTDQTIQENIRTTEKVNQLRLKMELVNARKKLKSIKFPIKIKSRATTDSLTLSTEKLLKDSSEYFPKELYDVAIEKPHKTKETFSDKTIQKQSKQERNLSAESKTKIKENLSRNRSFKTILSQPAISTSSSSMSLFNNDMNTLEFCFSGNSNGRDIFAPTTAGSKLGRSLSFQSNYILNRTDSNLCVNTSSLATMEAATISNSTPIIQEYECVEHICEPPPAVTTKETKTGYSTSMQDLLLQEFLTKSSSNSTCSHFQITTSGAAATATASRDFTSANSNNSGSALTIGDENIDMFKGTAITSSSSTKASPGDEYFVLPKLLVREDSPPLIESPSLGIVKESDREDLLDVAAGKQTSAESLIEFYENLTSSSTSSLASKINDYECFHQPPTGNRFYHSDLDLNQLNDRFKNNLSISNQNMNTSEGNLGADMEWQRSNLLLLSINQTMKDEPQQSDYNNLIEDVNYDKFLNDLLNNDLGSVVPPPILKSDDINKIDEDYNSSQITITDSNSSKVVVPKDNEMIDLFTSDIDSILTKKMTARRITPLKKPLDKLKSFSSNPQLGNHNALSTHESGNLAATTSTTTVHIPQLSRLDAVPTKYRRGMLF